MHGSSQATHPVWVGAVVTGFVGYFVNLELLPAKCEHFRHERHSLELAVGVQRSQNLLFAPDFHPVANSKFCFALHHFVSKMSPQNMRHQRKRQRTRTRYDCSNLLIACVKITPYNKSSFGSFLPNPGRLAQPSLSVEGADAVI